MKYSKDLIGPDKDSFQDKIFYAKYNRSATINRSAMAIMEQFQLKYKAIF